MAAVVDVAFTVHLDRKIKLNQKHIYRVVGDNIGLLLKAFKNQCVIPEFEPFCKQVEDIYNRCKNNNGGELASYIPELTREAKKVLVNCKMQMPINTQCGVIITN